MQRDSRHETRCDAPMYIVQCSTHFHFSNSKRFSCRRSRYISALRFELTIAAVVFVIRMKRSIFIFFYSISFCISLQFVFTLRKVHKMRGKPNLICCCCYSWTITKTTKTTKTKKKAKTKTFHRLDESVRFCLWKIHHIFRAEVGQNTRSIVGTGECFVWRRKHRVFL